MRSLPPALAAVMTVAVALCASCSAATPSVAPVVTPAGVRFSVAAAGATSVALAGAFNQWSAASHPLTRDGRSGVWTIVVPLPPGEHPFMFVIDGNQWITPPAADDFVDDGFGARNGVVVVRPF
jgi:1,4-alpha-glucan branching enzyme